MTTNESTEPSVPADEFRGGNAHLCRSIEALIALNDKGALVPHGIGGHARSLLAAAYHRLSQPAKSREAVRFKVIGGSQSAHCCFEATVIDTSKPDIVGGKQYEGRNGPQFESVCECFDLDDAEMIAAALNAPADVLPVNTAQPVEGKRKFQIGDRVTKTKGSSWTGLVVGSYSTSLTPEGYAVESENEPGSVQIYPASALASKGGVLSAPLAGEGKDG